MNNTFTEVTSSMCKDCANNITKLAALNPLCVHCIYTEFIKTDLFRKKENDQTEAED